LAHAPTVMAQLKSLETAKSLRVTN
jgi:hypothetical protein